MTVLRGRIWDLRRGVPLEARVQVLASTGELCAPQNALHKVGSGEPFFYAGEDGFEVDVPGGPTQVVVERGTEYTPLRLILTAPWTGTVVVEGGWLSARGLGSASHQLWPRALGTYQSRLPAPAA